MELPPAVVDNRLKWWFWISLLCNIVFIVWIKQYLAPLRSGEIVQFEMAKTPEAATAMIARWRQDGVFDLVVSSIRLDYLFILLYTSAIAIACRLMSALTRNALLIKAGIFFSFVIFLAGIFDIAENISMMKSLGQSVSNRTTGFAYKMAVSKFSLIFMSLIFIGVCLVSWVVNLVSRKEKFWK